MLYNLKSYKSDYWWTCIQNDLCSAVHLQCLWCCNMTD